MSVPEIVAAHMVRSYRNRDNVLTDIGSKRWIYYTVNEVKNILIPVVQDHTALDDMEDELYTILIYIDESIPEPHATYLNEDKIWDLGRDWCRWMFKLTEEKPDDYPEPGNIYENAQEAAGECFVWHYAAIA